LSQETEKNSRVHDLLSAVLGIFAAVTLFSSPWNVDTEGPDPFYKGPLIFPIMVLSMMIAVSIPACIRLLRPSEQSSWHLDGEGSPKKTIVVLVMLICMVIGLNLVGLSISSWLFLTISLYYLGHRQPLKLIVLPLVMTGLIVLVFKCSLGIFFPTPLLVEWLWE